MPKIVGFMSQNLIYSYLIKGEKLNFFYSFDLYQQMKWNQHVIVYKNFNHDVLVGAL